VVVAEVATFIEEPKKLIELNGYKTEEKIQRKME
jgi:hypothetical protein